VTALIYIGGYGRSGSTLLESLLATRLDILACGEVVSCLRDRLDRGCTCGKSREECSVWAHFFQKPEGPRGLSHTSLTLSLLDRAASRYSYMVDSSKTAWGSFGAPFKLRQKLGNQFHLIHVVRDPRAVCWSNAGGTRKRGGVVRFPSLRHLRTTFGWWLANLSCELFGLLYPERYKRVRYEDIARSHAEALATLFAALPTQRESTPGTETQGNRHQLRGNQSRYESIKPAEIREDARWKSVMPVGQQAFVGALTWPLRTRYGY
jgi:sulfotransferase family protein